MKKRILVGIGVMLSLLGGCKESPTAYETGTENLEQQKYTEAIENFQDAGQSRAFMIRPRKLLRQLWG